ncbi:MAG TPA: hypothetical protein VNM24_06845 [Burkholderiales bacterium]|nr:hypothetical protein [Burkholderiales bacterium]
MNVAHGWALCLAGSMAMAAGSPGVAQTEPTHKMEALIAMHDLRTSVSIGRYYLKQEALLAVRERLVRLGAEHGLGAGWNSASPYWRQAEEAVLEQVMSRIDAEFDSLQWLKPLWMELTRSEFSDEEIDALLAHFRSEVGRKQVRIVDHTVSTHVMMRLSFAGRLKEVPGADEERSRMQQLWNDEDREMRFSIEGAANAEGQRFALSPLGKKYLVTAVLKLTGLLSRRIEDLAAAVPGEVDAGIGRVQPLVEEFKHARG